MNHLKKSWKLFISMMGFGVAVALACAGGDWDESEGSMFAPQIINKPQFEPFFRTSYSPFYTGYYDDQNTVCNDLNIKEWQTYFDGKASNEMLDYWLYKASGKEVNNMIFTLKGTTKDIQKLNDESRKYTFLGLGSSEKSIAFLYYLGFAKRNESFSVKTYDYWDDSPGETTNNGVDIKKQIDGGLNFFSKAKDVTLKERYLFQVIRLYYFNNQYNEAIELYNKNITTLQNESSMKWRSVEYVAGCYYKLKKYAEANYLYSLVYAGFDEHRKSAYLSFHPQEENDWKQSLQLAKNNKEKAGLWLLFGLYNDAERAINEIYKLDSKSESLELLLVRLVNLKEESFTNGLFRKYKEPVGNDLEPNTKAADLISEIALKGNTTNPALWNLAAAYLNYSVLQYSKGDQFLKAAEPIKKQGPLFEAQYHLVSLSGKLSRAKKMDMNFEKDIIKDLQIVFVQKTEKIKDVRIYFAQRWARNVISVLYAENGEFEKAEMVRPGTVKDYFSSIGNVKRMIDYYEKQHSELEDFFLKIDMRSKSEYQNYLGIRYAQKDMLDSSLAAFKAAGDNTNTLPGNPFNIHIKDCHDCDHLAHQKIKYTQTSFIEKMLEMENKAKSSKSEAAQNYFLIANGFYNMTYYGNARIFYQNSVNEYDNYYYDYGYSQKGDWSENNCSLALKYYLLAKDASNDKEFKAECVFMASKCELNEWYQHVPKGYEGDFKSGKYFQMLKKEYASTNYFNEVLNECSYFSLFMSK